MYIKRYYVSNKQCPKLQNNDDFNINGMQISMTHFPPILAIEVYEIFV